MSTHSHSTTDAPGFFIAVSIELGCPGIPGMPAGNLEGLYILRRFLGHRLAEAEQLLMPVGASGELNDCVFACKVRDLDASVAIIKEALAPVLIISARIAWFDFRESFFRPVFPDLSQVRPGALINEARVASLRGRASEILHAIQKP